jgi:hypothetical protein
MNELSHRDGPIAQWRRGRDLLAETRRLVPIMKSAPRTQDRDDATRAYVEAVDELVVLLGVMADTGALEAVEEYFAVVYGG